MSINLNAIRFCLNLDPGWSVFVPIAVWNNKFAMAWNEPIRWEKCFGKLGMTQYPETGRKSLTIKKRRRFGIELKRGVLREGLNRVSTETQLMRCHDICSGRFYHWEERYQNVKASFDNPAIIEGVLEG